MTTKISLSQVTIPVTTSTGTAITVQADGSLAANTSITVQGGSSSDAHPFLLSLL